MKYRILKKRNGRCHKAGKLLRKRFPDKLHREDIENSTSKSQLRNWLSVLSWFEIPQHQRVVFELQRVIRQTSKPIDNKPKQVVAAIKSMKGNWNR